MNTLEHLGLHNSAGACTGLLLALPTAVMQSGRTVDDVRRCFELREHVRLCKRCKQSRLVSAKYQRGSMPIIC